jgi:hypothetical protein
MSVADADAKLDCSRVLPWRVLRAKPTLPEDCRRLRRIAPPSVLRSAGSVVGGCELLASCSGLWSRALRWMTRFERSPK